MRQTYRKFEADENLVTRLPFKQIDVYQPTVRQRNTAQYPILSHIVLDQPGDLACKDSLWFQGGVPWYVPNTDGPMCAG